MSKKGKHLKFWLSSEFRHLSIVQIRFCESKICNQNALPALLYESHMKCQQRQLSPASVSEDSQWEEEEVILLNTFCITVLLWKYLPPSPDLFLNESDCGSYAMCWSWCCHYALRWAQSTLTKLGHWVDFAQGHTVLHRRWTVGRMCV